METNLVFRNLWPVLWYQRQRYDNLRSRIRARGLALFQHPYFQSKVFGESDRCDNKRGTMTRHPTPSRQTPVPCLYVGHGFSCLTLLLLLCTTAMGLAQEPQSPVPRSVIRATHVLGFEGARHNTTGDLRIQGEAVEFQRNRETTAEVGISSVQDIFVEDENKQIGGTAMTLGKAAVPYGGGRVVSLFAHKKYDVLTVEYLDNDGGFHGAIFQLGKGQGQSFENFLVVHGAHVSSPDDRTPRRTPEVKPQILASAGPVGSSTNKKNEEVLSWSVLVDRVDADEVGLEPSFRASIYESLLEELAKTRQFKQLFRSGDRKANDVPSLLILKTTVQKYTPGSETRRAVTTVGGATKLNVRIQLLTRDGRVVLGTAVNGNVRFMGGNLRATHNLAHNVAQTLKRSTLPKKTDPDYKEETGKTSN